jgi:hypothetical protein
MALENINAVKFLLQSIIVAYAFYIIRTSFYGQIVNCTLDLSAISLHNHPWGRATNCRHF